MRASEARYRAVTHSATDAIVPTDSAGNIVGWNRGAEQIFGYTEAEVCGQPVTLLLPSRYLEGHGAGLARVRAGGERHVIGKTVEVEGRHKNGREFAVELSLAEWQIAEGWLYTAIIRDITERKQAEVKRSSMELQLRQAQKLESIGQLAAGIAHEINTPTQYIGDNTRFLESAFTDLTKLLQPCQQLGEFSPTSADATELVKGLQSTAQALDLGYLLAEIPKALRESLQGLERVNKIVQAMKEFSHPGTETMTPVDLNRAIESTVTVATNEWKYVAAMALDLEPSLPLVPCLPGEINQVILNLVINAAYAVADVVATRNGAAKGTISVSTRRADTWVEIRVGDTGTGIPEKIRHRVFDPFFTTKPLGKGTGQGLAIARSVVVDKHQGTLTFETEVGRGTIFLIRLPLSPTGHRKEPAVQ